MLLSEFSKMLGAEINDFEMKPELSEIKKLAIEYIAVVEDRLISLSAKSCSKSEFITLLGECSQNSKHKKEDAEEIPTATTPLEQASTADSLDSIEEDERFERKDSLNVEAFDEMTKEAEGKSHRVANKNLVDQIQEDMVSRFEDLEKDYGDVHDNCYLYAIALFKKFASTYSESDQTEKIHSTISQKGLFLTPNNNVLTPVRLFKACFLLAFKMIEEDFELFLMDFCQSMGEEVAVLGRIEVLVCLEQLDFGFGGISLRDLTREEEFLRDLLF